jgi:glycosyltransferase involved in cell wall biosynthesis
VPHPIFVLPQVAPDRARFGFPDQACIVLQAFDLRSTAARKNPLGGLDAYLRAVPQASDRARLVCKLVGAQAFPDIFAQLKARVAEREDLILIADELSAHDMLTLTASADVILSLHRAEGFGLLLAEGMWLGKPVVATAWSGNMDFMDADSAALIDYKPMVAKDPQGMYSGALWADPDLDAAAERLRALIGDPAARVALGERARARALVDFDREAWLTSVKALLLGSGRPERF